MQPAPTQRSVKPTMKSGRVLLSFNVIGMAAREAMLLKSFVRMLDGRTRQRWLFKPQQDYNEQQSADLIFLGDEGTEPALPPGNAQAPRQLRMGMLALDLFAKLDRPLRPDELERELNRMGTLLVQARAVHMAGETVNTFVSTLGRENVGDGRPSALWRPVAEGSAHSEFAPTTVFSNDFFEPAQATAPEKTAASAEPPASAKLPVVKISIAPRDGLRLLRWPQASLISTPARLKLAAFMTGESTTLNNLQKTSGQSLQACAEFVQDLNASGFLSITAAGPETTGATAKPVATRAQSGAIDTAVAKPPAQQTAIPQRNAPPVPSLFARIRVRLGISAAG